MRQLLYSIVFKSSQWFNSLKADLRQDEIGGFAFIICGFGNSTQKKRRFVFVKL